MKAIIKQKSKLQANLTIEVVYDIVEGQDVLLDSQTVSAKPSELVAVLQDKVAKFQEEYEKAQAIDVPTEVE